MVSWQIARLKYRFMSFISKIGRGFSYLLGRILFLIEFFLLLRVALKFLGANPFSFAVTKLYWLTDFLVWPVASIFPDFYFSGRLVDMVAISAMIGYAIAFVVILGLLKLIFRNDYL